MGILARRGKKTNFERAADGSMTLMEHLHELRSRLFKACVSIVLGLFVALYFSQDVLSFITAPYCELRPVDNCEIATGGPAAPFILQLRVALYLGLAIAAPFWLYQLWAFIAPGLHRHERKYSYLFAAIAAPLFVGGAVLGHFVVAKSIPFLLELNDNYEVIPDLAGIFDFVAGVMLLFALGFEFPLIMLMLNFTGVISARRMLSWWRAAVFITFLFGAIVTPTPDPFGMSILAISMSILYFAAVGVAFLNDRRRGRDKPLYANLADDQTSPIESDLEAVGLSGGIDPVTPVPAADPIGTPDPIDRPMPLERRYDDAT